MIKNKVKLTNLKSGQQGIVEEISGGQGVKHRLEMLGIRKGKEITRINNSLFRGPVTIKVGETKIAIGYGMAAKIIVSLFGDL